MKLAIIGDSHTASWKLAWTEMACAHADFDLTFFAGPGQRTTDFKVDDGKLVAGTEKLRQSIAYTSGGLEKIDPAQFDAFVVCGLFVLRAWTDDAPEYSLAVYQQTLMDTVASSMNYGIARKLRQITDKPIYICHRPFAAAKEGKNIFKRDTYAQRIEVLNSFTQSDIGATVVAQAAKTVVDENYTLAEFTVGSRRLDVGSSISGTLHDSDDTTHMNADFGAIALENLFGILQAGK